MDELAGRDLNDKREADFAAAQASIKANLDEQHESNSVQDGGPIPPVTGGDGGLEKIAPTETPGVVVTKTITTKKVVIVTSSDGESVRRVTQTGPTPTLLSPAQPENPGVVEGLAVEDDDGDEDYEDVDDADHDDSDDETPTSSSDDDDSVNADIAHDPVVDIWNSSDALFLGLRVYTHKDAVAVVGGQSYSGPVPVMESALNWNL